MAVVWAYHGISVWHDSESLAFQRLGRTTLRISATDGVGKRAMGTLRDTDVDGQPAATERDLSLIRGGPFYRAQRATRLIHADKWNHVRRLIFAISIGWVPLILITVLSHPENLISLLRDYRVHSRLLIAVPALLLGEFLLEARFRMVIEHIGRARLLEGSDLGKMDNAIRWIRRLRDSLLPELMILLLVILHGNIAFKAQVDATPWLAQSAGSELHLTLAGWYAVVVSATMFQFLLGLALWQWLLWTLFAFRLSRLNLRLAPTHPDGHGGLGFLGLTPIAFTPTAFAACAVIAGTWRHEVLNHGADLMSFKLPAIVLVVIIAVVAFSPLLFFVPKLSILRHDGMLDYGVLAQIQVRSFHEKWVLRGVGHESDFPEATDGRALASFGQSYRRLLDMNPFPADKGALLTLALSVFIPMLPLILSVIPITMVLKLLLKALH